VKRARVFTLALVFILTACSGAEPKLLLSFGGATSPFNITDPNAFAANLVAYVKANPKALGT
jgi:hypothetical protein